jgi:hypothetical protein
MNTTIKRTGEGRLLEVIGSPDDRSSRVRGWTIQDLTFSSGSGSADMIHAEYADAFRVENVVFGGWGHAGNSLFVKGCWDWRFVHGRFASGGDPDEGTADVYATDGEGPAGGPVQTTNNFRFVSCHWERLQSYGLYLDNAGGFRLDSCKFHGQPSDHPPVYHIDGTYRTLHVSNTRFGVANTGFVRTRAPTDVEGLGRSGVLLSNNFFHNWRLGGHDAAAIDLAGTLGTGIANNYFDGGSENRAPAIALDTTIATVTGNLVHTGGIRVDGGSATVNGNQLYGPPRDGITVTAPEAVLTGNVVRGSAGSGIHVDPVTGGILVGNAVRNTGGYGIDAPEADGRAALGNLVSGSTDEALRIGGSRSVANQNVTL